VARVSLRELERLAHMPTNLDGMRRCGYVTTAPARSRRSRPLATDSLPVAAILSAESAEHGS